MKYQNIAFTVLKYIEKKNIEKNTINIKNLYLKKKQYNKQITLLMNYENEYTKKLWNQIIIGTSIFNLKNYRNFIILLNVIIQQNKNFIEQNEVFIKKNLNIWFKSQLKLNIWKYLDLKYNKKKLKKKQFFNQIIANEVCQLKILKKGCLN